MVRQLLWMDILTPKQVLFASAIVPKLERAGYDLLLTTRRYREVNELLRLKGLEARCVGKYGGAPLADKLKASLERCLELMKLVMDHKPQLATSYASPEAARVAFGLGIPHVCICDSPHAEAVCKLTVPLSRMLLTPRILGKDSWLKYGIAEENIATYDALDPVAWIRKLKPNPEILNQLGLDPAKPIALFRLEEAFASYLVREIEQSPIVAALASIEKTCPPDAQLVALPRYPEQIQFLKAVLQRTTVLAHAIDGPNLLSFTSAFVGGGGTMTAEAALLGVPTLSCYPGKPPLVERYLIEQGLVIRAERVVEVEDWLLRVLKDPERARRESLKRAKRLLEGMEDPAEVVLKAVADLLPP